MNNDNDRCNLKSNAIQTLQHDNFIPFKNSDLDAFINVSEDYIVSHFIDDYDSQ